MIRKYHNHKLQTNLKKTQSFDSMFTLEDAISYQLSNHSCLNCVHMSKYGDQTHCENLDCVDHLEKIKAGYLLNHPCI